MYEFMIFLGKSLERVAAVAVFRVHDRKMAS